MLWKFLIEAEIQQRQAESPMPRGRFVF